MKTTQKTTEKRTRERERLDLTKYRERVTFRLKEDLYDALVEKAIAENRTLSNYIVAVLSDHVDKKTD